MAEKEEYIIALKDQFLKPFKGLMNMVKSFNSSVKGTQENVAKMSKSVAGSFSGITKSLGPLIGAFAAIGAVKSVFTLGADAEQAQVSFEVMLGSAEKATKMVADLKAMGAATPFEFTDLQDATKTLLAFGMEGKAVLPTLQALGDVSGGNAEKLQSLATVFGQISSLGKLQGGDLLQLINVGFNPLEAIAKRTGKSMTTLKDEMSKGLITFDMVQQAFADATSEGGRFYGMMEKQSMTTAGRLSTLQDQIASIGTSIGSAMLPHINKGMDKISYAFDWLKQNFVQLQDVFAPLMDAFQPLIDTFSSIAQDMGLMSGEASILKTVFSAIGNVIKLISPLLKFTFQIIGDITKTLFVMIKAIYDAIAAIAKFAGFKAKDFKFTEVEKQEAVKTKSLDEFIKEGNGAKPGTNAASSAKSKSQKISDSISGVSGGRPTSITINVGSLIKENINQITNINGGAELSNFMDKLKASLMTMLNDSQVIAQG